MKTLTKLLLLPAFLFAACSDSKDPDPGPDPADPTELTVKAYIGATPSVSRANTEDEDATDWTDGDIIGVNYDGTVYTYSYNNGK